MALKPNQILIGLSIGALVLYIFSVLASLKSKVQLWVSLLVTFGIVLVVSYFLWNYNPHIDNDYDNESDGKYYNTKSPDDYGESSHSESNLEGDSSNPRANSKLLERSEDEQQEFLQKENFSLVEQKFSLNRKQKPIDQKPEISYAEFKNLFLTPEFLQNFYSSVKESFKLKRKKLIDFRNKCLANLETLKRNEKPKSGIEQIYREMLFQNEFKILESTINSIDQLLKEIRTKETNFSLETARSNLISAVLDRKQGIESLTGREEIKDFLALQLYTFSQNPRIFFTKFQNLAIYGPPGIGKTRVAEIISHVYASSGILIRNHVQSVTKSDFTTAYVNESGRITRKLLLSNLESVVFIDEAYDMTPPKDVFGFKGIDHGHEAIATMVNLMNDIKGLVVIIVAGYEKEMEERFMKANKGLPRRFPHVFKLKPYKSNELTRILVNFLYEVNPNLKLEEVQLNYLYTIIDYINREAPELFDNQAGDMDNLSGYILRSIYGSLNKNWKTDYEKIILRGVNTFLSSKGSSLQIEKLSGKIRPDNLN